MIIWRQITKLKFSALIFITLCLSPYLKSYVRNGPSIITAVFRIIKDRKKNFNFFKLCSQQCCILQAYMDRNRNKLKSRFLNDQISPNLLRYCDVFMLIGQSIPVSSLWFWIKLDLESIMRIQLYANWKISFSNFRTFET